MPAACPLNAGCFSTTFLRRWPPARSDMSRSLTPFLLTACLLLPLAGQAVCQTYEQARGVIHLDSTVSGGEFTPQEMADFLKKHDIQVGIFTDHDTVNWDYGFFPAKWLIGKLTGWLIASAFDRAGSVQSYGAEAYVDLINTIDEQEEDLILLPGVEAIPFFYWEGSLLFNTLSIHQVYKHLLAFGLPDPQDYDRLPSVGSGFFRTYGLHSILSLWPIGLLILIFQVFKATDDTQFRRIVRPIGTALIIVCLLFLTQNFPYAYPRYDQYHGDKGTQPYQDFIDFVENRGGMVFWAHPEIEVDKVIEKPPLKVAMKTPPYHVDLLYTQNYTGFSAFFEGMKHIIPVGAIWDQILNEYCQDKRARPIWAIAEGDIEGDHFSPQESETVFLLKERTQADALAALREGRIYAVAGPNAHHFTLESFTVSSPLNKSTSGQTLTADPGDVTVTATITFDSPTDKRRYVQATLIRDGEPIGNFKGEGSLEIEYQEQSKLRADRLHYYRIDANAPNQTRLLSNPIFLKPGN